MKTAITVGETYAVKYPFVRVKFELPVGDWDDEHAETVDGWRPGTDRDIDDGCASLAADGHGEMLLTVVSKHKPGNFPERVMYTRKWKDPDGRVFGRGKLRITTVGWFRRLLRGYRHDYEDAGVEE